MANTLTNLIPTIYDARNVVSREMTGFIPAVTRNTTVTRAAVGQVVTVPVAAVGAAEDITPGVNPADSGDAVMGNVPITISKSRAVPVRWTGEEQMSVGENLNPLMRDQFAEAMRTLINEIETDLANEVKISASRAFGTAGTAPFGTANVLTDFAQMRKILRDNGAPQTDLQLVLDSAAWVNLNGKQSSLFKVNEAGSDDMLRNGMTDRIQGFALRDSAGIAVHTIGTGSSYLLDDAASAAGDLVITVDTGSGTIVQGDILTSASNTVDKYVVTTALAGAVLSIGKPGLIVAIPDDNALTVGAAYSPNAAFSRSAVMLATRAPALPEGGDAAEDRITVPDPVTGINFEISAYRQYRQVKFEVAIAWGQKGIKSEHIALLIG